MTTLTNLADHRDESTRCLATIAVSGARYPGDPGKPWWPDEPCPNVATEYFDGEEYCATHHAELVAEYEEEPWPEED